MIVGWEYSTFASDSSSQCECGVSGGTVWGLQGCVRWACPDIIQMGGAHWVSSVSCCHHEWLAAYDDWFLQLFPPWTKFSNREPLAQRSAGWKYPVLSSTWAVKALRCALTGENISEVSQVLRTFVRSSAKQPGEVSLMALVTDSPGLTTATSCEILCSFVTRQLSPKGHSFRLQ